MPKTQKRHPVSFRRTIKIVAMIALLSACSNSSVREYQNVAPIIVVEKFFEGNLRAYGVVKDRGGDVTRHFKATIKATWDDDQGVLDEVFYFNDGEVQHRQWMLTKQSDSRYRVTANDVVGDHVMETSGNALFLQYILQVPYKGSIINVSVDDKMFLLEDDIIMNESIFYKWGFRVGSVQLMIEKL